MAEWQASALLLFLFTCPVCNSMNTGMEETWMKIVSILRFGENNMTMEPADDHPANRKSWARAEDAIKKRVVEFVDGVLSSYHEDRYFRMLSRRCRSHVEDTFLALKEMKYWAFQMVDSSSKLPSGILNLRLSDFGDFKGCLDVDAEGQFQGKYCVIRTIPARRSLKPGNYTLDKIPQLENFSDPDGLVPGYLRNVHPFYEYLAYRTSLCVPSTCSMADTQVLVQKIMDVSELGWPSAVTSCQVKETFSPDTSQSVAMFILSIFVVLAVMGTAYDVFLNIKRDKENIREKIGTAAKTLLCFSVYSNTKKLLNTDISSDSIKAFHGMKVVTLLWVILNHTYNAFTLDILSSALFARESARNPVFHVILNGFPSVETFFFMSAVLVVYGRIKVRYSALTISVIILRRLWRLTPSVIGITLMGFLLRSLGSGPLWNEVVTPGAETCKRYWWANLVYVNNYFGVKKMCLPWLWYLAADFHLYLLSLLITFLVKKKPKASSYIILCFLLICAVGTAYSQLYYKVPATVVSAIVQRPEGALHYLNHGYYPSHLHSVTTCVGVAVGYILYKRPKIRLPQRVVALGWTMSVFLGVAVVYCVYAWNTGVEPNFVFSATYAVVGKIAWSVALGWVTVMTVHGFGGFVTTLLGWRALIPLSRLSFAAYLVHPAIQNVYIASLKKTVQADHGTIVFFYLGFVVSSFMAAYAFSQFFEAPFMALEKLYLPRIMEAVSNKGLVRNSNGFVQEVNEAMPNDLKRNGNNGSEMELTEDSENKRCSEVDTKRNETV